jgi:hypothetical protein
MTAKKNDQQQRGIQMAVDMRKSKKREILTKKRYPQGISQELQQQEQEYDEYENYEQEYYEFPDQVDDAQYEDDLHPGVQTVEQHLNNQ